VERYSNISPAESNKYSRLAQQTTIQADQAKTMEEAAMISFMNAVLTKTKQRLNYILKGLRLSFQRSCRLDAIKILLKTPLRPAIQ
jgi:predicted Zn-dependent protease